MIQFAVGAQLRHRTIRVLDFGGGGGQFALVFKSMYPLAEVFVTDVSDESLLPQYAPLNIQIPHAEFATDRTTFDVIFLNDVFEHVADPIQTLRDLRDRLAPDGYLFIDTPKSFWLYPATRWLMPPLHRRLLNGTVSRMHLQIWSRASFYLAAEKSQLKVAKYEELSEFTMGANYYLDNMKIENPLLRLAGQCFYSAAPLFAKNKIMSILKQA